MLGNPYPEQPRPQEIMIKFMCSEGGGIDKWLSQLHKVRGYRIRLMKQFIPLSLEGGLIIMLIYLGYFLTNYEKNIFINNYSD